MDRTHELSQLLVSCWVLGGENQPIPTSHGLLDHALRQVIDNGALPDWAKDKLHFVDSRVGLKCVELPDILKWAQRSELTSVPNPSFQSTAVQVSEVAARRFLARLGVSEEEAYTWGRGLRDAVEEVRSRLQSAGLLEDEDR
jgi:hypothetical protein